MNLKDIQQMLMEKKLTKAELKKREEIAQAMEREHPGMGSTPEGMAKKMAIATAQAKRVAEEIEELDEASNYDQVVTYYRHLGLDPYKLRGSTGRELRTKIKNSTAFQAWMKLRSELGKNLHKQIKKTMQMRGYNKLNSSYEYDKTYSHIIEALKDAKKESKSGDSKNKVIFFGYPDSNANTSNSDKEIAQTDDNFISSK